MEHLLLKATVAAVDTDQGIFEAVISTQSVDREKDIVSADGMVDALRKWNRPVPLAWNHSTKAEDIFGALDPQTVKNVNGEVVASGQVDLDSSVGKEAWRSFKARTIGFSFGYLIVKATKRAGGGRDITELDVFEVTATPTPMNNDTRVLSAKAIDESQQELEAVRTQLAEAQQELDALRNKAAEEPGQRTHSDDPLRRQATALALEVATGGIDLRKPPAKAPEPEPDLMPLRELKRRSRDLMLQVLSDT